MLPIEVNPKGPENVEAALTKQVAQSSSESLSLQANAPENNKADQKLQVSDNKTDTKVFKLHAEFNDITDAQRKAETLPAIAGAHESAMVAQRNQTITTESLASGLQDGPVRDFLLKNKHKDPVAAIAELHSIVKTALG